MSAWDASLQMWMKDISITRRIAIFVEDCCAALPSVPPPLLLADRTAVLLCLLYRPQWQHGAPLSFLTDELDTIMATHSCQNTIIRGGLEPAPGEPNLHRAYNGPRAHQPRDLLHACAWYHASLDPVLSNLPADSVQCYQLDKVGSSDHNVVLCEVGLNPASEEGSQRTIWLWEKANWRGLRAELASTNWESLFTVDVNPMFTVDVSHNVATLTSLIISAQARHVPHREYRVDPGPHPVGRILQRSPSEPLACVGIHRRCHSLAQLQ
ncbi:uncharacterized protein LOC123517903 [Portunus trituberculatus]|uniref:uncharacterized protein LOC123517903 n=1 Tax=Portunus trituberculatus TaxID=210409 RepID=UPI001E1CB6F7|nr:uncharacterized protein LOC123517903 [Portunus trituberculatus]